LREKNDKKLQLAWAFYDWANSVYPLIVTTAIFPTFYEAITTQKTEAGVVITDKVEFFGYLFSNTELYSYVISASFLVVSFLSPLLSGLADFWGNKKFFLKIFCYLGAISCGILYFFNVEYLELSMIPVFTASIGFWGSLVFYNAYLPEIAEPQDHDKLSARGFSLGYIGSALLLIIILILIMVGGMNARYSFIMVMVWWIGFAQYSLLKLPTYNNEYRHDKPNLWKGIQELKKVWNELKHIKLIKSYLGAFFVYSMGVQTVLLMAVLFAAKEVDWGSDDAGKTGLIISVLLIQFIAIIGAGLFSRMSKKFGNIRVLKVAVFMWVLICTWAYFIETPVDFYITAGIVGFVMGGIQALSRSTYSKMLPETEDHASYFSFYDVLEKIGIVIGTLSYGLIEAITGSLRNSIFALAAFFVVGLILLFFVPKHDWSKPTTVIE
jgi:UMF1 family MFS transporter|tara:strand:+ start:1305 stop:2618 length:1314 start_codon:yes stop_codon:yes gene_type:complete